MEPESFADLQEEKNIILKEINETLDKIKSTMQEINEESLNYRNTEDVEKLQAELEILTRKIVPQENKNLSQKSPKNKSLSQRQTKSSGKSIQIIEQDESSD